MRKSMRPVTLSRVIEIVYLAQCERELDSLKVTTLLGVSNRRAKDILEEVTIMGFLIFENGCYTPAIYCENLLRYVKNKDFENFHELLMKHPFYSLFYNTLKSIEPATKDQILDSIADSNLPFNNVAVDILCDWGERIESIQRNVFTNQYYSTSNSSDNIMRLFLNVYKELNININFLMSKRYVEIPKIREVICQRLNLKRRKFDDLFRDMYLKNIGLIELSGAPLTTQAKKSSKKVKKAYFSEVANSFSVKFSSDQYLTGLDIGGKIYYYVAYHGGILID